MEICGANVSFMDKMKFTVELNSEDAKVFESLKAKIIRATDVRDITNSGVIRYAIRKACAVVK